MIRRTVSLITAKDGINPCVNSGLRSFGVRSWGRCPPLQIYKGVSPSKRAKRTLRNFEIGRETYSYTFSIGI